MQDNGGKTPTLAITTSSPAYNFTSSCSLSTDQRGVSRPQPSGGDCDLGAFELDLTEPDTAITAQPADPSNSSNPSFSFSGTDTNGSGIASFQCQLDGGSWLPCNSGSNVGPLGEASHTFNVRAVDRDGNIDSSPASYTWSVDLTRPSVTIDQSGSQTDPAIGSPINFAVVFSKPVSGFIGSDVSLSGQAGATTAVVTGGPAMYNVAVSGMTGHGSVIASIASNVATDTAGNLNFASTSTDNAVDYIISIPGAPDLLSPSSGALLKTDQPLLDWNHSVPAAHHYQIQISSAIDFTTLIMGETNILASQFSPSIDLVPGETYYWRVRGINALGDAGSWSNTWSFGIKFSASGALLAPAADEHVLTLRPAFDWVDATGAGQYTVQVSKSIAFSQLLVNNISPVSTFTSLKDLPPAAVLYWRVRVDFTNGSSDWSEVRSFSTPNPPGIPSLISPNIGVVLDSAPRLRWMATSLPRGTVFNHYQLQLASSIDFTAPIVDANLSSLTDTNYGPAASLTPGTTYYWRVRAINQNSEASSWSEVRSFGIRPAIQNDRPTISSTSGNMISPGIIGPGDATVVGQRPVLDWSDLAGATGYLVQVATDPHFASSSYLVFATTVDSRYVFLHDLPSDTELYWRVSALYGNTAGSWSLTSFFVIP